MSWFGSDETPEVGRIRVGKFRKPGPWVDDALCADMGPDMFYPAVGWNIDATRSICMACPVRNECAEHGIEHEVHGVWGGHSRQELVKIRRQRGIRLDEDDLVEGDAA